MMMTSRCSRDHNQDMHDTMMTTVTMLLPMPMLSSSSAASLRLNTPCLPPPFASTLLLLLLPPPQSSSSSSPALLCLSSLPCSLDSPMTSQLASLPSKQHSEPALQLPSFQPCHHTLPALPTTPPSSRSRHFAPAPSLRTLWNTSVPARLTNAVLGSTKPCRAPSDPVVEEEEGARGGGGDALLCATSGHGAARELSREKSWRGGGASARFVCERGGCGAFWARRMGNGSHEEAELTANGVGVCEVCGVVARGSAREG